MQLYKSVGSAMNPTCPNIPMTSPIEQPFSIASSKYNFYQNDTKWQMCWRCCQAVNLQTDELFQY